MAQSQPARRPVAGLSAEDSKSASTTQAHRPHVGSRRREAGIGQPGPEAKAIMAGLASIEESLEHLAEAVDGKRAPAPTSPVLPIPQSAGQPIRTRQQGIITP